VQAVVEVQDTASKAPPGTPRGSGTFRTRHFAPFHASASGSASPLPLFW